MSRFELSAFFFFAALLLCHHQTPLINQFVVNFEGGSTFLYIKSGSPSKLYHRFRFMVFLPMLINCMWQMYICAVWCMLESSCNVMAHGDAREGKWRGNWQMEWVASTLHTTVEHDVSSINTADAHNSAANSRLKWRPRADLNGLVRFAERRNLVSAHVPSHFKRSLLLYICSFTWKLVRIAHVSIAFPILYSLTTPSFYTVPGKAKTRHQ